MTDLEFYPTPGWMTRALLAHLPQLAGSVLEPCCGDGAIADVLETETGLTVTRNDLEPRARGGLFPSPKRIVTQRDATEVAFWAHCRPAWVITNPPFSRAPEILPLAFEAARVGVAMLLRLSYLEPVENRGSWLKAHPPTMAIFLPRGKFRGGGSDQMATWWGVWQKEPSQSLFTHCVFVTERGA